MLARYMLSTCVRPSVRLSVTRHYCIKTAKRRITQITPYDSHGLLHADAKDLGEIPPGSSPTGAPNRAGVGSNRRFSTSIPVHVTDIVTMKR